MRNIILGLIFLGGLSCKTNSSSELDSARARSRIEVANLAFLPIRSLFSKKVLDVKDRGVRRGTPIQQWSDAQQTNQRWRLRKQGDGNFIIQVESTEQCLDLLGFDPDDGAEVVQWDCNQKPNQRWKLVPRGTAWEIRNVWNGKCLDVLGFDRANGAEIGVWTCKGAENQLWQIGDGDDVRLVLEQSPEIVPQVLKGGQSVPALPQIVGTQIIGPAYRFSADDPVLDGARAMAAMGTRTLKSVAREGVLLDQLIKLPFQNYLFWYRSDNAWVDGFSEAERSAEYDAMFAFAKRLLSQNAKSKKNFYIGHWEGDWYLLSNYDAEQDASSIAVQGMIQWLNTRQRAIEEARKAVPQSKARIYQYTEVNRVRDAMVSGKSRLVNKVLPFVDVDYVSYSSYDVQSEDEKIIHETLDYIEAQLKPKSGLSGRRVFIGEFGISAGEVGYDGVRHLEANREILRKFISWKPPFLLYWAMYNNVVKDGRQEGYWLIDDKGRKQPLYEFFKALYLAQEDFVSEVLERRKSPPSSSEIFEFTEQWLKDPR